MRIIIIISLLYLIRDSASECPVDIKLPACLCYEEFDLHPAITCRVNNISELVSVSNAFRHNLRFFTVLLYRFTVVPSSALHYDNLTLLVIHGTDLTSVNDDAFADLEDSLATLTLHNARFQKIPVSAISRLRNLEILEMDENEIVSVNESLRSMPLHTLSLCRNRISEIGSDVLPESLINLKLAHNRLVTLNCALRGDLAYLDISNNEITSLEGELNNVPKLQTLEARYNEIRSIENCFSNTKQLERLTLASNDIREISNGLHGLDKLEHLNLCSNNLSTIERHNLEDLTALKALLLSSNELIYVDKHALCPLVNLTDVDISFNWLHSSMTWLVSVKALTGVLPEGEEDCSFTDNPTTLRSLNMTISGIFCSSITMPALTYLVSKGVDIVRNPC